MALQIKKIISALGIAIALSVCVSTAGASTVQASDEEVTVKDVGEIKIKALSETSVKLTWKKVKRAEGYHIVRTTLSTGKKVQADTEIPSLTDTKIVPSVRYKYQIYAFVTDDEEEQILSSHAASVKLNTKVIKPAQVKNLTLTKIAEDSVSLSWDKVKDASRYVISYKVSGSSKYKTVGETKKTKYKVSKLKTGQKYLFHVKAIRKVAGVTAKGKVSKSVSATPEKLMLQNIRGRVFSARMRSTITTKVIGTDQRITIPAGTHVFVGARWGSNILSYVTSDVNKVASSTVKRVYLNGSQFSSGSLIVTSSVKYNYTPLQRENYINKKGYGSPTSWFMWTDQYTSTTSFFKGSKGNWKHMYTSQCVVGAGGASGVGLRRITYKGQFYGEVGGSLGGNAYHRLMDQYTRGSHSHGCIRLPRQALYYFWNNVPVNTTVLLT